MVIKYDKPEIIRVKCELHPWMRGVFVVLKSSHYSVSDEGGSFTLPIFRRGNTQSRHGMSSLENNRRW